MPPIATPLDAWLARLETLSVAEIDLGLERVESLLDRLELQLPATVLHVAGTNGKGSSVAMLEALLRQTGRRVGCYTSPHILRYNERVRVDGREADDLQLTAAFETIEAVRCDVPLTYFEFGTLAALSHFTSANVDIAILEVGMGGRLDAVNAVEPTAGLITNIALDHCDWLGDDVEKIAFEKAGIMRAGKPVVFAARERPNAIDTQAASIGAELVAAGRDFEWTCEQGSWSWQGVSTDLCNLRLPSLHGKIQVQNAAGVLAMVEAAGFDDLLNNDVVDAALTNLQVTGRMQRISLDGVDWLLDVAHNPAAAAVLAAELRQPTETGMVIAVTAMLDDKNVEGIVSELHDIVDHWIAVTADNPRAISAAELSRRVANASNKPCLATASVSEALDNARRLAGEGDRIVVTGSFYLVGPVLEALELYSPR